MSLICICATHVRLGESDLFSGLRFRYLYGQTFTKYPMDWQTWHFKGLPSEPFGFFFP